MDRKSAPVADQCSLSGLSLREQENNTGAIQLEKCAKRKANPDDDPEATARKRIRKSLGLSHQQIETSKEVEDRTPSCEAHQEETHSCSDHDVISSTLSSPEKSKGPSQHHNQNSDGSGESRRGTEKRTRCEPQREEDSKRPRRLLSSSMHIIVISSSLSSAISTSCTIQFSRDVFDSQYTEEECLGEGGFGTVFAGYRRNDRLPVAIKHIHQTRVRRTTADVNGQIYLIPLEVALMYFARAAHESASNVPIVALIECFDLENEVILVMERPVPCMDLMCYIKSAGPLHEHIAKDIQKQLVDAAIHIHSNGIFHRDIKPQNILIQTDVYVPRIKLIDFGCSSILTQEEYKGAIGTLVYNPPEMHQCRRYKAEPTTVWQLAASLYTMLHGRHPFKNKDEVIHKNPTITYKLSTNCCNFLMSCLAKNPEDRPTLEELRNHPWLQLQES